MSDTPITDFEKQTLEEWVKEYDGLMIPEEDKKPWYLVHEVTVKKLERERDEAREERDKLKLLLAADSERIDAYLGVCIERDEARSVADGLAEQAERLRKERDEAREERDELRSEINYYRIKHDLLPISWDV